MVVYINNILIFTKKPFLQKGFSSQLSEGFHGYSSLFSYDEI